MSSICNMSQQHVTKGVSLAGWNKPSTLLSVLMDLVDSSQNHQLGSTPWSVREELCMVGRTIQMCGDYWNLLLRK